eukprot:scaffold110857_cov72-Phaeocystis_antarctica.AAC.4
MAVVGVSSCPAGRCRFPWLTPMHVVFLPMHVVNGGRPVAGLTTACKLEPFRDPSRESPESLPEPTQSSAKACLRRAQPPPPLRRTPLRTLPHTNAVQMRRLVLASPHAAHCIPSRAGIALHHLPQSFLDTIHTDVFSALHPPLSCPSSES